MAIGTMFEWEGAAVDEACRIVSGRDPRHYRIGLLTVGPWPDGPACALQWFVRHTELAQFLLRVEPRRAGLRGADFIGFKTAAMPVITAMEVAGLNEDLRQQFNEISAPGFGVHWWGSLESLKSGETAWPRAVLAKLQATAPLPNARTPELLELLRRDYPPPQALGQGNAD
ncbi:hypothetical protein M0534_05355 [Methylonatrum kenyense]|uniref:hypothetical protein n=1 Tax=Methylonatrum kenyense TaxID=455253 RepID=UPI0020C06968|nr:hypothetical protein [Methylonatrum kenyense]MCK8515754.1 hypothetical protein [Methylonatrum kenyense]